MAWLRGWREQKENTAYSTTFLNAHYSRLNLFTRHFCWWHFCVLFVAIKEPGRRVYIIFICPLYTFDVDCLSVWLGDKSFIQFQASFLFFLLNSHLLTVYAIGSSVIRHPNSPYFPEIWVIYKSTMRLGKKKLFPLCLSKTIEYTPTDRKVSFMSKDYHDWICKRPTVEQLNRVVDAFTSVHIQLM